MTEEGWNCLTKWHFYLLYALLGVWPAYAKYTTLYTILLTTVQAHQLMALDAVVVIMQYILQS